MENHNHRNGLINNTSSLPSTATPNRSRRRQLCFVFLLAYPLFLSENSICEAFIYPSRKRRLSWTDNHRKQPTFIERKKFKCPDNTLLSPSIPFFPSMRQTSPKPKMAEESDYEHNSDREREDARRKKWGHDDNSDVYEDLEKLERAIRLENAEFKLKHAILQEKADFIDYSKREVVPDVLKFVIVPLVYAFGLFKMASNSRTLLRTISRTAIRVMDLHFWTCVVWAPVLLNFAKRISKPPPDPVPDELARVDIKSLPAGMLSSAFDWEDSNENCDDNVLFLTEYWTSAVNGMVYLQFLNAIATMIASKIAVKGLGFACNSIMLLWLSCAQMLTRIGAVVSLYQYPEKMYDFERSELTRPVGFFPTLTWKLVRVMMVLAPLGVISDFSKILLHLPKGSIYPLYGSIAVSLYGTWARMQESISKKKDPLSPTQLKPPKPVAKLVYGLSYLALWRNQLRLLGLGQKFRIFMGKLFTSFYGVFWKCLAFSLLLPIPLMGPLVHIKAFRNIFEVEYANDLPSLSTAKSYQQAIDEKPERAYDMAWRYSLRWRPPQRLATSKSIIYDDIAYRCLVKGTAVDILVKLSTPEFDDDAFEKSLKRKQPSKDRDNWKTRAMDFQAKKHQKNYESGNMDDALGVAVWRAFGIGIGFNFEHMKELEEGQEPSPRRLQARAAKSAVRRYSQLHREEKAMIKHNESLDPEERDYEKIEEAKKQFDEEIKYLAGRLTDLIPTSSNLDEFGEMNVAKFKMKEGVKFRKVSPNEIQMLEENPLGTDQTSDSAMLLNNIERRRRDTPRAYDTLLNNGGEDDKDKTFDDDGDDDSSTDGRLDIEYV
mmetsp:Transcript_16625/g.34703  ORF Transcript_16625/g.34703 Transcript_16625/m.34703 type:complete len:828 (+) Transcript_16625:157-2640(+)